MRTGEGRSARTAARGSSPLSPFDDGRGRVRRGASRADETAGMGGSSGGGSKRWAGARPRRTAAAPDSSMTDEGTMGAGQFRRPASRVLAIATTPNPFPLPSVSCCGGNAGRPRLSPGRQGAASGIIAGVALVSKGRPALPRGVNVMAPVPARWTEVNRRHWFAALAAVTGADPVSDEDAGDIPRTANRVFFHGESETPAWSPTWGSRNMVGGGWRP